MHDAAILIFWPRRLNDFFDIGGEGGYHKSMGAVPRINWMELNMGQGRPALPFSSGYVLARPGIVCVGLYVYGHDINFFIFFRSECTTINFFFFTWFII